MEKKLNKAEAGFHLLQILSAIDGDFHHMEDLVITNYLSENYPFHVNLDAAVDYLSTLPKDDYVLHFQKCMNDFYQDSEESERMKFLDFAVKLVKADNDITNEENIFLNLLFQAWERENE
ncbi:MAG: TerB family tellurite resistance protein [Bacteroidetes bacterium]|nr:MAG: TerB family tellurite resistance protein [Bacteroidota bacterium]REJ99898.1 MAG: TerB family tellurite resistance protein [Bacteroidota bacterium]REK34271.1 MAG: TerB family tellurite resistance protein [Bacteroidota bacterium]REK50601.1 MAG: TerB family tellurite resistance protein [Bacteroidota bacterium]